jgi:hypothetical protein
VEQVDGIERESEFCVRSWAEKVGEVCCELQPGVSIADGEVEAKILEINLGDCRN